jgi:hypothetical protein
MTTTSLITLSNKKFTCVTLVNFFQIGAQTAMSKFGAFPWQEKLVAPLIATQW